MNDRSQTDKNEMSDYPLQLEILWAYRLISKNLNSLLLIVFLGISASLFIALTTPEVYRAEMVIKSAGDKNKSMFSQISNQLSGIAGSLGMNIGEQSGQSYSSSVATLYSRVFLQNFILDKNLMKDLFPEDWDHDSNSWKDPEAKPTMQDAYEVFSERIFLNRNEKTGIIDFAFEWSDPDIAASLANDLIFSELLMISFEVLRSSGSSP